MGAMPHNWLGLVLAVFIRGLKHGMDPDHLATIDGPTRFNAHQRPRLSRLPARFGSGAGLFHRAPLVILCSVYRD